MLIAEITENSSRTIHPLAESKGTRITVYAGAGYNGEGENGGKGGTGMVRHIEFYNLKPFKITARFTRRAKNGTDTNPAMLFGQELREPNFGGKAGFDADCKIKTETNEYEINCRGGGGGGGGGFVLNTDILSLVVLGANGGALADGSLNFKSSTFKGGRGQDGDTECFYNEDTQTVQCDNPVNLGPAKIIVESL